MLGEGMVKSTLVKDDEEVDVVFPNVGMKKLSTAFAPLERLGQTKAKVKPTWSGRGLRLPARRSCGSSMEFSPWHWF